MSTSRSTIAALIFGGISFLSLSFLLYYFYFKPSSSVKAITDDASKKQAEKKVDSVQKKAEVTVEDDSSSDDDSDEDDEDDEADSKNTPEASSPAKAGTDSVEAEKAKAAADEAATLKEQYDAAIRTSTRLIQGQAHGRAIEKLTEAITLAQHIPSASKDMLTLYNNRSAMYEKLSQYENCLRDITVVLTMDPHHMKARVRRARVYEAQNKHWESLQDYVYAMILERIKGEQPTNER